MENSNEWEKLCSGLNYIRNITNFKPKVGLVLGSGLGEVIDGLEIVHKISYKEIPFFPKATASGHKGRFLIGYLKKVPVIIMQGRIHFYEGYQIEEVVRPIRLMKMLGCEIIILTNSAGAINVEYREGQLIALKDHIASFVPNPLRGHNIQELGIRFPNMSEIYSKRIRNILKDAADKIGMKLEEGIYLQTAGPSFESPAEINMYRNLGVDVVGMSTACEAIVARHMGMEVGCISCISNMASGITGNELTIDEVIKNAELIKYKLGNFLNECIIQLIAQ